MYRHLPPLNPLRAFEAAARHGSFTKAAEELFVTQGAVSRHVKKLEEHLGAQLFVRDANNIYLTNLGKSILPTVSLAFENINQTILSAKQAKTTIRIQIVPSFAWRILMPQLSEFQDAHRDISVRPSIMLHPETFDAMSFDAGIIYGGGTWPNLHATLLSREVLQPVCSPDYLARHGPIDEPATLADHILLHNSTDRRDWSLWLNDLGVSLQLLQDGPAFETMDMAVRAARDGMGVVVGDLSLIQADLRDGKLVTLFDHRHLTGRGIYFVCEPAAVTQKSISTLLDWLLDVSPISVELDEG